MLAHNYLLGQLLWLQRSSPTVPGAFPGILGYVQSELRCLWETRNPSSTGC